MIANEKRLIDANALMDTVEGVNWYHIDKLGYLANGANSQDHTPIYKAEDIYNAIRNAPTVDAVEIPCRCKECKYWKHYDHLGCTDFVKVCTLAYYMIGENGYCLYGERKDNGKKS